MSATHSNLRTPVEVRAGYFNGIGRRNGHNRAFRTPDRLRRFRRMTGTVMTQPFAQAAGVLGAILKLPLVSTRFLNTDAKLVCEAGLLETNPLLSYCFFQTSGFCWSFSRTSPIFKDSK